jgi:nucleotide-binding universal stress UspA family protein
MADEEAHRPLVTVGIDGSKASETVLRWAAAHARHMNARIRVVLAWQFPELPGYVPPRVESQLSAAAERVVADLVEDLVDTEAETVVQEGGPVRLLLQQARDADLLVLGRHGHGHADGKMLGSVVSTCVMQAPCPVVVVPLE